MASSGNNLRAATLLVGGLLGAATLAATPAQAEQADLTVKVFQLPSLDWREQVQPPLAADVTAAAPVPLRTSEAANDDFPPLAAQPVPPAIAAAQPAAADAPPAEEPPTEEPEVDEPASDEADEAAEAEAEAPDTEPSSENRLYTVQPGDTFARIAERELGDERLWVAIAEENPLTDPTRLTVGQEIRLPGPDHQQRRQQQRERVAAAVERAGLAPPEPDDGKQRVTVAEGDTLSAIARQVYGRASDWPRIYEANRDQLDNPARLQVGMRLVIPPLADAHAN